MKIKQVAIPCLLIYTLINSCTHKIYDSLNWQTNKVVADGNIQEWSNPLRFYDDKSKINYTISNDRKNLYLCMKIPDEAMQSKILHNGVEFRIDTLGKTTFPISFIFPIVSQETTAYKKRDYREGTSSKQKILSQPMDIRLIGFKQNIEPIIPAFNSTHGFSAGINIDNMGVMYYEAIIPFNTFYKNELTNTDANTTFNYSIKINSIPKRTANEEGRHSGGMGGGMHGGGGMHRNGELGERQGTYSRNNGELYISNEIVTKMKFSIK